MFRATKVGPFLAVGIIVACSSSTSKPPVPAAPIVSGTYDGASGPIAFLSFPDATQYQLTRNQPCDAGGANECDETGTFTYDAATRELSLKSDDTLATTVYVINVQEATVADAAEALEPLGGKVHLVADGSVALTTGQTSLTCPPKPATVQTFAACPKSKTTGSGGGSGVGSGGTGCSSFTTNPLQMPADVVQFLTQNGWGNDHLRWHTVRQWDLMVSEKDQADIMQAESETPPWTREAIQEGQTGNGEEFLLMHRAMLITLRKLFPCADFTGWSSPPTNANDASYPVPKTNKDRNKAFDANMLKAVSNLESSAYIKKSFTGANADDQYGLYIETNLRWVSESDPTGKPTDVTIGLHNYVHNRFSDCSTDSCTSGPIDMGDPSKNLANQVFWKHHGWIDNIYSAVRAANNESDTDPAYQKALTNALNLFETNPASGLALVLRDPRTSGIASFVGQQQRADWGPRN